MKRFGDFLLISEEDLKKSKEQKADKDRIAKAKEVLEKAKSVKKEKLAGPNEFMNDPKNEASHVKKFDELVTASTSPSGGMATGKSMDQSKKKMEAEKCGYTMKDDKPHGKDSPEDKAHDVVEGGEKVSDAVEDVKGDPKKMFEHLRSYRQMKEEGKADEWKRSPKNAEMGKSGVSDPMLMSMKQRKEKEEMDKRCWEGYEPTPGKKAYEKGSCQPAKKAMDKNDPAVSGTKVESQQSGEIGNRAKAKDDSVSPLQSEPKQMIAEPIGDKYAKKPMQKSMKEGGGVQWTEADAKRGLAFSAGGRVGATEGPNLAAQPLVKKEEKTREKGREVPLHRVLEDMDDSKVKT